MQSTCTELAGSPAGTMAVASTTVPSDPESELGWGWTLILGGPSIANGPKRSLRRSAEGGWESTLLKVPFSWDNLGSAEISSCLKE